MWEHYLLSLRSKNIRISVVQGVFRVVLYNPLFFCVAPSIVFSLAVSEKLVLREREHGATSVADVLLAALH